MVKFNPPEWKPLYSQFEERTGNGANCPKCGKRAVEHRITSENDYGGTKIKHELKCDCGQYFVVHSYVPGD